MITTLDKGDDDWSWSDGETLFFENSDSRPIRTSDVIFTTGKYAGSLLSEIVNSWYLKFIIEKNPKDHFINVMFGRRLKELQ